MYISTYKFNKFVNSISSGVLLTEEKASEIILAIMKFLQNDKDLFPIFEKIGFTIYYETDEKGSFINVYKTKIEGITRNVWQTIDFFRNLHINTNAAVLADRGA